jgi:hypothetical protein
MTDDTEERAFARMMKALIAAQREYDAALTPEERAHEDRCMCHLCGFVRTQRATLAEYEASKTNKGA